MAVGCLLGFYPSTYAVQVGAIYIKLARWTGDLLDVEDLPKGPLPQLCRPIGETSRCSLGPLLYHPIPRVFLRHHIRLDLLCTERDSLIVALSLHRDMQVSASPRQTALI